MAGFVDSSYALEWFGFYEVVLDKPFAEIVCSCGIEAESCGKDRSLESCGDLSGSIGDGGMVGCGGKLRWSSAVGFIEARMVKFCLVVFRLLFVPVISGNCRFTPTCSSYAHQAMERHGLFKGGFMCAWRILRCNPFSGFGYDPVPDTKEKKLLLDARLLEVK
ncbi:membrane protein insertion efficiency factor YidD [Candidatus Hydrogenosomobacter endosymbioticus]|uniref:Putative membrane protein insertion efficiency factor n=1 Tax=Candidatus Hydrogenosomobacter endosymbioticus TaxID=2558174 RepID=A0ABM7V9B2_9PROT|nr:membrane protein insertion efficiency factor YidD [Candidatus Hydrogenosomobacter endosymbioticus]BDB96355.1 hypothetical protein HYD_4880 [Candidatus Hydrogenosomobacter endosymbioticus]